MTGEDRAALHRLALVVAQARKDWAAVERLASRACSVAPEMGPPESALVAVSLHHAYQAFESMLERLARALGLPVPVGERSHLVLLEDAALDIAGLRPAIIPEEAQASWRELLRFRHFFRLAYHVELDPSELVKNRDHLVSATRLTAPRVSSILRALETGV